MECTPADVTQGENNLILILNQIIVGALRCPPSTSLMDPPCIPNQGNIIFNALYRAFKSFQCDLPKDIANQISTESSSTLEKVNLLYVVIIFTTLLLLVILIFVGTYLQHYLLFSILAIILIIIAGVILLFTVNATYKKSSDIISLLLTDIQNAVKSGFCCLGADHCKTC